MEEGELGAMTLLAGNHFYTVDFLDMAAELLTPYHIAKKKIPCIDETGEDPPLLLSSAELAQANTSPRKQTTASSSSNSSSTASLTANRLRAQRSVPRTLSSS